MKCHMTLVGGAYLTGALFASAFLSACIRCERCRDACPVQCIELAGPEFSAPIRSAWTPAGTYDRAGGTIVRINRA